MSCVQLTIMTTGGLSAQAQQTLAERGLTAERINSEQFKCAGGRAELISAVPVLRQIPGILSCWTEPCR